MDALARIDAATQERAKLPAGGLELHNFYQDLKDDLLEIQPFTALKSAWLSHGDGGSSNAEMALAGWLMHVIERGGAARLANLVATAEREIILNEICFNEITPLLGVSVLSRIDLSPEIALVPSSDLPDDHYRQSFFSYDQMGTRRPSDYGAIVYTVRISPVIISDSWQPSMTEALKNRDRTREIARAAVLLSGTGLVEPVGRYVMHQPGQILATGGWGSSNPGLPMTRAATSFDSGIVQKTFQALNSFNQVDALLLAIDRLGRSRVSLRFVDQVIDLGMAMEIALMHGEGDGKSEITAKTALRAGWLLGAEVGERKRIGERAKSLYNGRSGAVHSGSLNKKVTDKLGPAAGLDIFVSSLLRKILAFGTFPNWTDLAFGGSGYEPTPTLG